MFHTTHIIRPLILYRKAKKSNVCQRQIKMIVVCNNAKILCWLNSRDVNNKYCHAI